MNEIDQQTDDQNKPLNTTLLIVLSLLSIIFQLPFLFLPAKRWDWIEAWVYLIFFFITMLAQTLILNKKNPQVLRNRMNAKKSGLTKAEGADKWILPLLSIDFLALFLIPGFDEGNNWSDVPIYVEIIGFLILGVAFYILYRSMLDNAFASKVLDIRKDGGHKVIDTGSYGVVRHPMYTGFLLMGFGLSLALGSWYALIPAALFIVILVMRIKYEEEMLIEGLEGYEEYQLKVKYKLFPKIY